MGLESSEQIHGCDKTNLQDLQQRELAALESSLKDLALRSSSPPSPSFPCAEELSFQDGYGQLASQVAIDASEHIDSFLKDALNSRNRITVLRFEQEIEKFMQNPKQQQLQLKPIPSSYDRLAAHRVAQHYGLHSTVVGCDAPTGSRILLLKTSESKLPSVRLGDLPLDPGLQDKSASSPLEKVAIKKRASGTSKTNGCCNGVSDPGTTTPSKTIEEREDEYDKARARIFCLGIFSDREEDESVVPNVVDVEDKLVSHNLQEGMLMERAVSVGGHKHRVEDDFSLRAANRVAIFRDREKDMKDPDYNRSYDRYSQCASSQIQSSGGSFDLHGICPPSLNSSRYSGLDQRGQPHMCLDRASFPAFHHFRGPWASSAGYAGAGYSNGLYGPFTQGYANFSIGSDYLPTQRFTYTGHFDYMERHEFSSQPTAQYKDRHGEFMHQG